MNLFARLVGRSNSPRRDTSRFPTSRAGRSTARRSAPALAIELLEQRWTPAVSVIVTNAHNVSIQDSDSGKTSNVVEIIDDYNDHNTYIKINGGAKTLLNNSAGAAGYLQNIGINMAGGDDKVIFSTIGAGTLDHDLERSLALGQGTDAFTLNLAQNLGDHEVTFTVWGQDGKDTYNVNGGFSNGDLVLDIVDHNGSDTYNLSPGFLSNGAWFNFSLVDVNGGANKFKLTQGNLNASYVSLDVHFNGDATNTITFAGNATLLDGGVNVSLHGGTGKETVNFDDNYLVGTETYYEMHLDKGNDVVTAKLDGKHIAGSGAIFAQSLTGLNVHLGDGDDAFTATAYGQYFAIDAQATGDLTSLGLQAFGENGNDTLKFLRGDSTALSVSNPEAYLSIRFDGGNNVDTIKVDLGKIVSTAPLGATVSVKIDGGSNGDNIGVLGSFGNSGGLTFVLQVVLGSGDGIDTLTFALTNVSGATIPPTFYVGNKITGGLDDAISASGNFFGKKITEWVVPSLS